MENEFKTKYWFIRDLKELASECTKVTRQTARRKASKLIKEYDGLFAHTNRQISNIESEREKYKNLYNILKSKKIKFQGGFLLLENIESVETRTTNEIIVTTKSGNKINFSKDFDYLLELF